MSRAIANARNEFKKVSHVIFDMDGLLLDTEGVYKTIIGGIAARFGKSYTPEIRTKLLGRQEIDTCKLAVKELALPINWEEFLAIFRVESNKWLTNCPLLPGAARFVQHLHNNKVPIAVATSSCRESFELKTEKHKEFFKLFHHTVTGGSDPEVASGKPSPDIFLVCASRFVDKPKPNNCLVFEDAPNGVTAAVSAGMQCVMVPDKETAPEKCQHATLVLSALTELKPESFGLPAFK